VILKGNQRGGGQQLAAHLLNSFDNEIAELAEVRGTVAQDLSGAFAEISAVARGGTKLEKEFYHLSVSPDPGQGTLTREQYFELLDRTERSLKLVGQPRAVVFHVKDGREHCHAVWSRVDTEKMRGINIAKDRLKLRDVTREFARDHGLELPDGIKANSKDKTNDRAKQEDLGERQQKERTGISKSQRMADIATCWRETGNGDAFVQAMEGKGYFIARGDKRAYVVLDLHGEIHSLSRQLAGVAKSKDLKDRLAGFPLDQLRSVEAVRDDIKKLRDRAEQQLEEHKEKSDIERRAATLKDRQAGRRAEIDRRRFAALSRHLSEREALKAVHEADTTGVAGARLAKQPKGVLAFLTRVTGIKMFVEARQRQQDNLRAARHLSEHQALVRRHDRELKEIARRDRALDRLERRENRAAAIALHREEFQRVRGKLIEMPLRKQPARELKPEFDRATQPGLQRTGTDDGRMPPQKGTLSRLFSRALEMMRPHPEVEPRPEPATIKPEFEKAAAPPIDLVAEFNREVDSRLACEDRDREPDGPGRDFDPKNPRN
jgi:Relaxase/Mobilisation nuclease domain